LFIYYAEAAVPGWAKNEKHSLFGFNVVKLTDFIFFTDRNSMKFSTNCVQHHMLLHYWLVKFDIRTVLVITKVTLHLVSYV